MASGAAVEQGGERFADDEVCPICGGVGFVRYDVPLGHPHFGKAVACACRLRREAQERGSRLRRLGGLDALADKTFDTFVRAPFGLTDEQVTSLRIAYERTALYAERPEGWLLLQGGYGCGKTHLAAAIANRQIEKGLQVLFVAVPDLLDYLRATYSPNASVSYDERFEQIRTERLLILDDLGAESSSPWAMEKLYQIFNYRYVHQLPTVITTNVELERLDPRIRSRLVDRYLTSGIIINAPDYRRADLVVGQSDLSSLHLYRDMVFEAFDLRRNLPREQQEGLENAFRAARAYAEKPDGWLVFVGGYGCGKTHLAAAIANHCHDQGQAVLFITVPDLLDHLRATFGPSSTSGYDERFYAIRESPLLILDDLGTENATPWAVEKLFQILDYRYVAQLPTVFTSAYNLEELDQRLVSRMLDTRRCRVIGIVARSYRGGKAPNAGEKRTSRGRKR